MADPLQFRYHRGGLHFPALGLWMDPHEPVRDGSLAFVSHAHSDHTGNHSEVVLTEPTRRLMRARVSGKRIEHVLALGETVDSSRLGRREGGFSIRLLPAGHILGSAMALLEAGGRSLLYTGDFKLRRGLSAEPCAPVAADVLVMETTFGRPGYVFPDASAVIAAVIRFCREALDNDEIPLLLGYSLGKSQEILSSLNASGLPVMLHDSVAKLTRIYADLGQPFPRWEPWDVKSASGHVLIAPPGGPVGSLRRQLPAVRSATLTGWAVDAGCRYRSGTDAAFPLSDHADFPDLVEMVHRVAPGRVFTLHGFAADFAAHLRTLGFDARPLSEEDQLELRLAGDTAVPRHSAPAPVPGPGRLAEPAHVPAPEAGSFAEVAGTFEAIRDTASKSAKVERLAGLLRSAAPEDLACLTSWFAGESSPIGSGAGRNAIGTVVRDAVRIAAGVNQAAYTAAHLLHNDAGETAAHLLAAHGIVDGRRLRIADVRGLLAHLATVPGAATKARVLADAFRACSPGEARLLTRILTGNLRIGLQEDRVEEAVAEAFAVEPWAIRRAHLRVGDLGETAVLALSGRLEDAALAPFRPLKALPEPPQVPVVDALVRASGWTTGEGAGELWIEDAPSGIRVQLHRVGERVALFSRDRREISAAFPELVRCALLLDGDVILDGRIPDGPGKPVERPSDDLFPSVDSPARFVASDLFWRDGVTLVGLPLRARRRELECLSLPAGLELSRIRRAVEVSGLDAAVAECRNAGVTGLLITNPESAQVQGPPGANSIVVAMESPAKPA